MADEQSPDHRAPDPEIRPQRERLTFEADRNGSATYHRGGVEPEPTLDPFYFLRVLHKRRWTCVSVFLIVLVGTAVYTFTAVPVYEARARMLIEPERINILKIEDIVEQDRSIDAQILVLQSRWLAKETMQSIGLLQPAQATSNSPEEPDSTASPEGASAYLRTAWQGAKETANRLRGRPTVAPGGPPEPSEVENAQIDRFLGGLTVVTTAKNVVDIRYRSGDPALAAGIVNGLAQQYIDQSLETRFAAVKDANDWLTARLGEQRQKVVEAEQALQQFRERNQIVTSVGAGDPSVAKLNELTAAMIRTKTTRVEKEGMLEKMRVLRSDPEALQRLPPMASDPIVQQQRLEVERLRRERALLAEKLQDRHPEMIKLQSSIQAAQAKLQSEMDRVVAASRDELAIVQTTEQSLMSAIDGQRREAIGQNRKSLELSILEGEVESNRQIYEMLMQRTRETDITKSIQPTRIRVLDAAQVPRGPISPNPGQNMLMALFGGLVLAIAMALGLDQLDNRVRTPDEIKTRFGLPLLGFIPEVAASTDGHPGPLMTNAVAPFFVEAMRSIRTNVLYSFADESLKVVVVTSATLSEGKTVTATNLAIAIAQTGDRVLLIDADMRRPTLHTLFSLRREPGLSNLMVGNVKASEALQPSGVPNLWVLPSGHQPPNPPELLGSQRFQKMIASFQDHFDWVLLDAPPVMPVTDAAVLAQKATGVVFVIGAERVARQIVSRALDQLAGVDARMVGGILTRVDLERNAYYHSEYYHRQYGDYCAPAASNDV